MRLLRMRLQNWRGVTDREIVFGPRVTIVEGPNEVGKSSLIEALLFLFRELQSTQKARVKGVKPAGKDVGSSVEAEIETGAYRFCYRKTFNRATEAVLTITAPNAEQLSGREAHERARQILEDTIDYDLWETLQVEQGSEVAQANLQDSHGLSRALDAAAGTSDAHGAGMDDTVLLERARVEYEKYFTPSKGAPRFDRRALTELEARRDEIQARLAEAEHDVNRHHQLRLEREGLLAKLPDHRKELEQQEGAWREVQVLEANAAQARSQVQAATAHRDQARTRCKERATLREREAGLKVAVADVERQLEPLSTARSAAGQRARELAVALEAANTEAQTARAERQRAEDDLDHLRRVESLRALAEKRKRLSDVREAKRLAAETLAAARVTDEQLAQLREAEGRLRDARTRLEVAIPTIEVEAHAAVRVTVDDVPHELDSGATLRPEATRDVKLSVGDLATVIVRPSTTAADLQSEVDQAESSLAARLRSAGADSVARAITLHARRVEAERNLDAAARAECELLGALSEQELTAEIANLEERIGSYVTERSGAPELPSERDAAETLLEQARTRGQAAEDAVQAARTDRDDAQRKSFDAESLYKGVLQDLEVKRLDLETTVQTLRDARTEAGDDALQETLAACEHMLDERIAESELLDGKLTALAPDRAKVLLENARQAFERARETIVAREKDLVAVEARLQQVQAEGLFERLNDVSTEVEVARDEFERTERAARAARVLWTTLNKHRDATLRANMRPLRERINQLGQIVFGPDFRIELDENLTIVSRTLEGTSLEFDALSVGTREQLGILARLAAAQLVAPQGGVPLILDDSLGFSDPDRLRTMGAVLSQAGKHSQVIVLTCTPGRFGYVGDAEVVRVG